ncbi:DUF1298-containing protein [Aureococcus anophagefferens]|nr:DUF1298-containing protein [Aureococcus anophagefferens]
MLSVAARAACVRFAAGASVVTAAHETDAAHCDAVRRKMTPIGAFSPLRDARGADPPAPFVVGAAREAALPGAVAEALTAPLLGRDGAGPWWEALVFDHAALTSVLLAHHCLADGVSLASPRATDQAEAIAAAVDAEIAKRRRPRGERRRRSRRAVREGSSRRGFAAPARAGHAARRGDDARAPARAAPRRAATGRSVAWASKFSDVATLKRVAKALGGDKATVNDLFAAIVGGALRDVLGDAAHVTCAVPVHLYGGALLPGVGVGNHIGAVLARLPLPAARRRRHVARVSRDVGGALRGGAGALVAYGAAYVAAAVLPRRLVPGWRLRGLRDRGATNVRGPPVDGASIRALCISGPPRTRLPVGFSS